MNNYAHEAMEQGLFQFHVCNDMKLWHASVGKNTAHRLAWELCRDGKLGAGCAAPKSDQLLLVNLDNDNLPGPSFISVLMQEAVGKWHRDGPMMLWFHGKQGGTCGRLAYWGNTFFGINGYDEQLDPVGYQDIDVINRISAVQVEKWGQKFVRRVRNAAATGEAIPNQSDYKFAVGDYKLKFTAQAGNITFGK